MRLPQIIGLGVAAITLTLTLTALPAAGADTSNFDTNDPYLAHAISLMTKTPLIDTHIDLPQIMRSLTREPLSAIPLLTSPYPGHVDIPRLRQGHLGAAFWTVWTPCVDDVAGDHSAHDFTAPNHHLRNALEVLDHIRAMIEQHPEHLKYAHTSAEIRAAHAEGKIASLIGMEGTHFLGSSLGALRSLVRLGVRYVTLTHMCHSAFASSAGFGPRIDPVHAGNGLTGLGRELVRELNRLGVLVDLSHVSDETARQAIAVSRAPVVWTHSGARSVWTHPRNVPDEILDLIGEGKKDAVVQSVFFPPFIGPEGGANLSRVADHIEYVAGRIGRNRVGIASDFDGMFTSVEGLEDASKYPYLVAEMLARGWTDTEVKGLLGENLMRIMDAVDEVKDQLKDELPSTAIWEKRKDLPSTNWGGEGDAFYPYEVIDHIAKMVRHDEL